MSETRIKIPPRGYYSMPRGAAQDARLTLEARGLLAMLLSLPDNWDYTVSGLAAKSNCGRDRMRRMLRELEDVGYLVREQSHDEAGKFDGNVYVVQDEPPESAAEESPECTPNFTVGLKTRQRQNPSTAEPSAGFAPQKINNLKDYIPPYSPPKGDGSEAQKCAKKRAPKSNPTWQPERFEGFWAYYPRGENRQGAVKAWDKLKPDDALIDTIAAALRVLKATEDWKRGIGIPYAATFLNGRRWEDAAGKQLPRTTAPPGDAGGEWTWE